MKYNLVRLSEPSVWNESLKEMPHTYYHTWEYCNAIAKTNNINPFLLAISNSGGKLICTLSEREKLRGYKEVYTPYGYGGIIVKCNPSEEEKFRNAWMNFGQEFGYTTAYTLQHPSFSLSNFWTESLFDQLDVYLLNLSDPIDMLWQELRKGHKYEIKKHGKDPNLKFTSNKQLLLKKFLNLYAETLKRVGASDVYNFSSNTLKEIVYANNSYLIGAEYKGEIQAVVLFLYNDFVAEYFLSAASVSGRVFTRNLVWNGVEYLKGKGISFINLGGGIKPGDDLDAFKRRFGGTQVKLTAVKEVFNVEGYDRICRKYNCAREPRNGFFPPYWNIKK